MNIDSIDAAPLIQTTHVPDLRRDIHIFVDYVCCRDVKRAHRNNNLSKADAKRLAKLMSDPDAVAQVEEDGESQWVDAVDRMALKLGFVNYDTKGEYVGYSSVEPSFPDNYIEFQEKPYKQFLTLTSARQERTILESLLKERQGSGSEFYCTGVLGRLDGFDQWGSATGIMPSLDFTTIRRFLLTLLAKCPPGQWLSTASLVAYLKRNHRYFLIPKKLVFKGEWDKSKGRYDNFAESKDRWGHEIKIAETDEDAFERVEGRYVERFLEGIPLLLNYVDVAYTKEHSEAIHPSIGCLKAFRVNERLQRGLEGKIPEPRVTVTPNFDVYVQFEMYPARILSELDPLCERVTEDTSIVLKLKKQSVAAACAARTHLDVVALLQRLSGTDVPANVGRELRDWSQHGDKFVLYPECSILETDNKLKAADPYQIERVAAGILLVRSPDKLFHQLEADELFPLRVKHGERAFSRLPRNARTRFPKKVASTKKKAPQKTPITLTRVTRVQLLCPSRTFLDKLCRVLLDAKCPVEMDGKNLMLSYSKQHQPTVTDAIRSLNKKYRVKIEDAG